MNDVNSDTQFMLEAVALAKNALWQTAPNPAVGAIIVKDGNIIARAWHMGPGTPHAEYAAIQLAREKNFDLSQSTLYVTLEPCNHYGQTPPCTKAILEARIPRVVVGTLDPNKVASGGAGFLQSQGVQVDIGIAEQECLDIIDDFSFWHNTDLPYTFLKLATTLDGRIATRTGHSKWITALHTRQQGHLLRRFVQAIVIGGNTFFQDDPHLTCRLENMPIQEKQPLAVIVTSRLPDATAPYYLLQHRPESTMFWTTVATAASPKAEALRKHGVRVIGLSSDLTTHNRDHGVRAALHLDQGLRYLRQELNCHYVLCEGGGRLGIALLDKGLVRELHLHVAPKILADNEATPVFEGRSPLTMDDALELRLLEATPCDPDIILRLRSLLPVITSQVEE